MRFIWYISCWCLINWHTKLLQIWISSPSIDHRSASLPVKCILYSTHLVFDNSPHRRSSTSSVSACVTPPPCPRFLQAPPPQSGRPNAGCNVGLCWSHVKTDQRRADSSQLECSPAGKATRYLISGSPSCTPASGQPQIGQSRQWSSSPGSQTSLSYNVHTGGSPTLPVWGYLWKAWCWSEESRFSRYQVFVRRTKHVTPNLYMGRQPKANRAPCLPALPCHQVLRMGCPILLQ